ncbi:MAG: Pirin family protein [Cyanobacteriota bacterium erpe_2018_sw_21hr_WHONDRS-SW48-000092_B_bin.40]|jgi:redox-sensitive bicupin YhaK (pirin superfamily)|nr:Pirin family protein [Cyanobacteriota bacterium erpe_2018_sw_21hr_WHONDRS-SW48-000092_B_bin.40]
MRTIKEIVAAEAVREGAGVIVHRPFPTRQIDNIDPFLLLDHMGPNVYAPGSAKGFPDHPHRGFETVSYMLEGALEHRDSAGNKGVIAAGDVQWMTAGSGVVHSEMPEENFREQGGRLNGFQLWVNLPKSDKMTAPRYQDTLSANIPVYESEDKSVWVKVIAGNSMGKQAVISTHIPILYLHVILQPGARFSQAVPLAHTALAYVISGQGKFAEKIAEADQLVIFSSHDTKDSKVSQESETIECSAEGNQPLSVLLIAGQPINEPIARYGPFVMNYQAEIKQALVDYQEGRMGQIA